MTEKDIPMYEYQIDVREDFLNRNIDCLAEYINEKDYKNAAALARLIADVTAEIQTYKEKIKVILEANKGK